MSKFEESKFKKGQSGNPKGRPKGTRSLSDYLKATDIENALKVLRSHLKRNSLKAAMYVTDQAFGKPMQRHQIGGEGGGPLIAKVQVVIVNEHRKHEGERNA